MIAPTKSPLFRYFPNKISYVGAAPRKGFCITKTAPVHMHKGGIKPRYHLASPQPHGLRPQRVPVYSCAFTGAPVADYLSPAQLRGHVQPLVPYPFPPNRGSLDGPPDLLSSSLPCLMDLLALLYPAGWEKSSGQLPQICPAPCPGFSRYSTDFRASAMSMRSIFRDRSRSTPTAKSMVSPKDSR